MKIASALEGLTILGLWEAGSIVKDIGGLWDSGVSGQLFSLASELASTLRFYLSDADHMFQYNDSSRPK